MLVPQRPRRARSIAALLLALTVLLPAAAPTAAADPVVLRVGTTQDLLVSNPWNSTLVVDYEASVDGHRSSFELFDLYLLSLFKYTRHDGERRWVLLRLFGWDVFVFSSGVGELAQ